MSNIKLPPYIVSHNKRKNFSRKIRDTEKEVTICKKKGLWSRVSRLMYILRNAWWGYKRYK